MLMVKAKNLKENVYNIYVAAENPQTEYNSEAIANIIKTVFNHKKETYKFGLVAFEKTKKDDKKTIKSSSKNHLNSAEKNTNHYNINKATQQLSFLNELFTDDKINFTAEIVYSQSEEVSKFRIVLDHIKRVNADIILINKNSFTNNNHFDNQSNLFELLSKSETPIITFV